MNQNQTLDLQVDIKQDLKNVKNFTQKYSKKTLSIILAVVMLISMCSVAFGINAYAATTSALDELVTAIECSTVLNLMDTSVASATYSTVEASTGSNSTTTNRTVTFTSYSDYAAFIKIVELVMSEADYLIRNNGQGGYSTGIGSSSFDGENAYSIYTQLCSNLSDAMGSYYSTYSVANLIKIIFYDWSDYSTIYGELDEKTYGNKSWGHAMSGCSGDAYLSLYYNLNVVTEDYVGWLQDSENDATDYANMKLESTYTVTMTRCDYSTTSCGSTSYYRAFTFAESSYIPTSATSEATGTKVTTLIAAADAYQTFIADLTATYPDFESVYNYAMSDSTGFDATLTEMKSLRSALVSTLVDGTISATATALTIVDKMYEDGADYANCYDNFIAAEESEKFAETAAMWNEYVAENPDYGTFVQLDFEDGVQLTSDYTYFQTYIYSVLTSSTTQVYEFFADQFELDTDYYTNFGYNVDSYKVLAMKEAIEEIMTAYGDADIDDLDEDVKSAIYTTLDTNLTNIAKYDSSIYDTFLSSTEIETYYDMEAVYETEVNTYVAWFYDLLSADLSKYEADELVEIFCSYDGSTSTYSTKLTGLKTFYNKIAASAGTETADTLLATLITNSEAMLDTGLYYTASVFEGQVAYAYTKYLALGDIDSLTWSVALYVDLRGSVGEIDTIIYDAFNAESLYTTYVSTDAQTQYAELLEKLIPSYEAYKETMGFDTYAQTDVEYVDREVYAYDIVKDDSYTVEDETLTSIIETVDSLIANEEVLNLLADLLGLDLAEGETLDLADTVIGLIEDMLFSDSIINVLVNLLYPLVGNEFNAIDLPPDYTDDSFGYMQLTYLMTMEEIAMSGTEKLAITPQSLATFVNSSKYPDAYAALIAAGTDWTSTEIYDADSGSLTINWGVDEACAAIDAAIADGTYDESVHGTKLEIFIEAVGTALEGIFPFLDALLCGDPWETGTISDIAETVANVSVIGDVDVDIDLVLSATAVDGYVNVVGAIYELLGYYDYMDADETADYVSCAEDIARMLFTDLYGLIEYILEAPVETILDALPNLVYALTFDMIPEILSLLYTDISYVASYSAIGSLVSGDALKDTISINVGEMFDLGDMGLDTTQGLAGILDLIDLDLSIDEGLVATLGELTQIETNRTELIYTGTASGYAYHIEADTEAVFYYLINLILGMVSDGTIYEIIEFFSSDIDLSSIEDIITDFGFGDSGVSTTDMIAAVAELFSPAQYSDTEYFILEALSNETKYVYPYEGVDYVLTAAELEQYDLTIEDCIATIEVGYSWDSETQTVVGIYDYLYSDYWTEEQASYVSDDLVNYVSTITSMFGIDLSSTAAGLVGDLLSDVFTTSTIDSILELVDGFIGDYLDDETISMLIDLVIDMDLVDNVDVATIINNLSNFEYEAFADGVDEAFMAVIADYLTPLVPVLKLFLITGSELSVYDEAISVLGYNGYESAIVPLFEAFGCDPADIMSYADLCAIEDDTDFVYAILDPILGLVDDLTGDDADFFSKVLDILPNILYFIEAGGLNLALTNLLQPVYAIFDTIRPIYSLSLTIDIDLVDIVDDLLAGLGIEEYISISFDELVTAVLTLGETEVRQSVVDDQEYNYVVISEDNYSHLVSIMINYVSTSLTIMENEYVQAAIQVVASLAALLDEEEYPELVALLNGLAEADVEDQAAYLMYIIVYGTDAGIEGFEELVDGLLDYTGLDEESQEAVLALAAAFIYAVFNYDADATQAEIDATISNIQTSLTESFTTIGTNISNMFTGVQDALNGYVTGAGESLSTALSTAMENAQTTYANIMNNLGNVGDNIGGAVEDALDNLTDAAATTTNAFVAFFQDLFAKISDFFANLFNWF